MSNAQPPPIPEVRVGGYRLGRLIGRGAMGAVHEAVNERLGLRRAVKTLPMPHRQDRALVKRFHNEARVLARLGHPSLVRIDDHGELPDGTPYILMEYLEGETLLDRIQRGRLSQEQALQIGLQLAEALAAAHAAGIVHRDVKPGNVILCLDPSAPGGIRAKLLDFGLAKVVDSPTQPPEAETFLATAIGHVMGTPAYMAPEQWSGAGVTTAQMDVYGLGANLYYMLAGQRIFEGASVRGLYELHTRGSVPSLLSIAPHLRPEVVALVHAMLAKEPAQRPEVGQVILQLRALLAPAAVSAWAQAPEAPRLPAIIAFILGAVAVAAGATGLVLALLQ